MRDPMKLAEMHLMARAVIRSLMSRLIEQGPSFSLSLFRSIAQSDYRNCVTKKPVTRIALERVCIASFRDVIAIASRHATFINDGVVVIADFSIDKID